METASSQAASVTGSGLLKSRKNRDTLVEQRLDGRTMMAM